ncbi:MAG TPA: hypothetical protein VGS06_46730 [Streptosporangiaceae bacterium]|nr:hypothetical protein [Streptosporangiaceae bacterium]
MAATRLTNGPAGPARRRTPVARRARRSAGLLAVVGGGTLALGMLAVPAGSAPATPATLAALGRTAAPTTTTCALGANGTSVKHVIYIQFDNVHYTRDNPNVPSDLQQMPNLLNFITGNGTLIAREHTPLIAHTADDIVTSETGLYGSDQGVPIANEYNYYTPSGSSDTAGSFAYWTDPIVDYNTTTSAPAGDSDHTLVTAQGKNAPAPWVPYTRAGCDFGSVAAADTELENTLPDIPLVYGANSAEAKEAENPKLANKAEADFMGLAVHCAHGSAMCAASRGGVADLLPDEPGGYSGYNALFGNKFIQPVISPSGQVRDLNGNVIKDPTGDVGFPGYNGLIGPVGLAYTLYMQTHGIPVTFTYLSDVHDNWTTGAGLGPGTATYESQLRVENTAFGVFFARLAAAGITKANTLFVITADEGDHFVGSSPSPATCDGVTAACSYSKVGEVDGNLTGMLAARGVTTPFDVEADSAPVIYVHGQPSRTAAPVRTMERAAAGLTASDLATGQGVLLTNYLADPVEMNILHMVTGDPKRTGTFTLFANPDFWLSSGSSSCGSSCVSEPSGQDAWNHGDVAPSINTTWLGLAGPGVAKLGVDNSVWSDHTDIQPTMMALLGLRDDYAPDGVVLGDVIEPTALPPAMLSSYTTLTKLARVYTRLEAAVGEFGLDTLAASTRALASDSPGDATYTTIEGQLTSLGAARDALAGQIQALLIGAEFGGQPLSTSTSGRKALSTLITQANALLGQAGALAKA